MLDENNFDENTFTVEKISTEATFQESETIWEKILDGSGEFVWEIVWEMVSEFVWEIIWGIFSW